MTQADKIALTSAPAPYQQIGWAHYGVAGYIPSPDTSLCIPDLVLNDAGQGVGDFMTGTTAFPSPIAQSASWDPAAQQAFGAALGAQAFAKGVNVQLAPGIETDRVPLNGRNWEYMSEDPFLAGQTAAAVVRGIQSQNVIATVKHYVANSQETNRTTELLRHRRAHPARALPAAVPGGDPAGRRRGGDVLVQPHQQRVRV